jgi:hypothetical protein
MPQPKIQIHGYAIISQDDRIADSGGETPASLRNEADWAYFQSELDRAELIVLGRGGHEANPNVKNRRRLVLSSAARGLERKSDAWWWNPAEASWREATRTLLPDGGRVAVPGGQAVFDLFLGLGYETFHLSRAGRASLPGGRYLFAACERGLSAETVLREAGLRGDGPKTIDEDADVALEVWRKL